MHCHATFQPPSFLNFRFSGRRTYNRLWYVELWRSIRACSTEVQYDAWHRHQSMLLPQGEKRWLQRHVYPNRHRPVSWLRPKEAIYGLHEIRSTSCPSLAIGVPLRMSFFRWHPFFRNLVQSSCTGENVDEASHWCGEPSLNSHIEWETAWHDCFI